MGVRVITPAEETAEEEVNIKPAYDWIMTFKGNLGECELLHRQQGEFYNLGENPNLAAKQLNDLLRPFAFFLGNCHRALPLYYDGGSILIEKETLHEFYEAARGSSFEDIQKTIEGIRARDEFVRKLASVDAGPRWRELPQSWKGEEVLRLFSKGISGNNHAACLMSDNTEGLDRLVDAAIRILVPGYNSQSYSLTGKVLLGNAEHAQQAIDKAGELGIISSRERS